MVEATVIYKWTFAGTNTGPDGTGKGCGSADPRSGELATMGSSPRPWGTSTALSTSVNSNMARPAKGSTLRAESMRVIVR